ncbi:MAG: hypothetical protein Q7J68_04955 [Thermoplasmata archaeon]|nr:hypothetical protein [Thermoplasmata archaeon]
MAEMFRERDLDRAIRAVSEILKVEVDAFLIGGLAMIKHEAKFSTKDVDIVFPDSDMAGHFMEAALKNGFRPQSQLTDEYLDLKTICVLVRDDGMRFDLFVGKVCGALTYSEGMKSRARPIDYGGLLRVHVSSVEDIFLFKSITSRPADLNDMAKLALAGVDWAVIEREATQQPDSWIWIGRLYGRLLELRDGYRVVSPLLGRLGNRWEISQSMGILLGRIEKAPLTFREAKELLREPDDSFVEKVLVTMTEKGLVFRKDGKYRLKAHEETRAERPADKGDVLP